MRALIGIVIVVALVALAVVAGENPSWFPGGADIPGVIYLLMVLLLVSGAGFGFHRLRREPGRAAIAALIWAALIAVLALGYAAFN